MPSIIGLKEAVKVLNGLECKEIDLLSEIERIRTDHKIEDDATTIRLAMIKHGWLIYTGGLWKVTID